MMGWSVDNNGMWVTMDLGMECGQLGIITE